MTTQFAVLWPGFVKTRARTLSVRRAVACFIKTHTGMLSVHRAVACFIKTHTGMLSVRRAVAWFYQDTYKDAVRSSCSGLVLSRHGQGCCPFVVLWPGFIKTHSDIQGCCPFVVLWPGFIKTHSDIQGCCPFVVLWPGFVKTGAGMLSVRRAVAWFYQDTYRDAVRSSCCGLVFIKTHSDIQGCCPFVVLWPGFIKTHIGMLSVRRAVAWFCQNTCRDVVLSACCSLVLSRHGQGYCPFVVL